MKKTLIAMGTATLLFAAGCSAASQVEQFNGKPLDGQNVQIYSHRGGRGLGPENTMANYRSSLRMGVDYIDMDINMTKDGVLVVTHDLGLNPNITRDSQGNFIKKSLLIHDLTYQQLQSYNVGELKPGTAYAKFFPYQLAEKDAKIPTLKQVIEYTKRVAGDKVGFQIEIKNDPTHPEQSATPEQYAKALYTLLKQEDVIDRTEVQAFDFACLIALNKLDPKIKTAYLTANGDSSDSTAWTAGYKVQDYGNSWPRLVKKLGGAAWEPYEMDITKAQIDEAHKLGLKVVVWGWPEQEGTEFNYPQVVKLINWGIDGIISDRPDELRGVLAARGYNLPQGFTIRSHS
ncbi:glycerophosphodiester phosphodiesterase family protein [Dongshaea marina]|uniref:glycerophosphodiester phosphodiesterase family protein n=1 Tax=Dongshaea marina TaxID=2047966 RepID=UPI00131EEA51|nr:glycerophosphodiester phosphodiesterase family protein [Dongshaea marina]